jgi:hypothetical protein
MAPSKPLAAASNRSRKSGAICQEITVDAESIVACRRGVRGCAQSSRPALMRRTVMFATFCSFAACARSSFATVRLAFSLFGTAVRRLIQSPEPAPNSSTDSIVSI